MDTQKIAHTVFKGTLEIGQHIFLKFFDGDLEQLRSTSHTKGASFRALAERCADDPTIRMSKSALHRAVGIAAVAKELGADAAFKQLAPTHQGALLPMRDPEKEIEKLAGAVLAKEMTVAAVAELVKEKKPRPEGEKRGRKETPAVLRALTRSVNAFSLDGATKSLTAAQVGALTDEKRKKTLSDAEGLVKRLETLIEKVKGEGLRLG